MSAAPTSADLLMPCFSSPSPIGGGRIMNNRCTHPAWCILLIAIVALWTLSPAGAAEKTIKYGIATPLSGPAAPWGIPHVRAAEMVFEEVNNQGGIEIGGQKYKIEIVSYDHKYVIA